MIFNAVTKLETLAQKKYFIEKINIYISLVESLCKKNEIELFEYQIDSKCQQELINMGVIEKPEDINTLLSILKKEVFLKLQRSVSIFLNNKELMEDYLAKLSNKRRKEMQEEDKEKKKINLVDLFCGAGGLSLGFIQENYRVVLANDVEQLCIETYKYNHPDIPSGKIVCGDIRKIVKDIDSYINDDVGIVVGGPPCQGFSSANKRFRIIDDPRNELYKYYIQAVSKITPKIVVMENVKGMLKVADQVIEDFTNLIVEKQGTKYTYQVGYQLLNSADFSVAQSRERLIYIAIRNDIIEKYSITPDTIFDEISHMNRNRQRFNLADALEYIRPLEAPHVKNAGEVDNEENGRKIDVNSYIGNDNDYLKLINYNRRIPLIFNHKARYCSKVNYEIYKRLNQGDDATDSKIVDIMPYAHRNDKFKDKYYKLIADKPCRTITAHLRSDGHSHIHPFQPRTLTPREAARIQSFPDDYLFLGPYLKTYIQIGNAVPVVMARQIAKVLKKYLE